MSKHKIAKDIKAVTAPFDAAKNSLENEVADYITSEVFGIASPPPPPPPFPPHAPHNKSGFSPVSPPPPYGRPESPSSLSGAKIEPDGTIIRGNRSKTIDDMNIPESESDFGPEQEME